MLTDILVILDRSGSMEAARADHEGGLRSFVQDQQDAGKDARLTLVQFDTVNPCEITHDGVPIAQVDLKTITLIPRGGTPLYDAIGQALAHLSAKQTTAPADDTIVMIITDGEENSSHEWTKDKVAARVKELEAKGHQFLFLGANIDAMQAGGAIGANAGMTMAFMNQQGAVQNAYHATSSNLKSYRSARMSGATASMAAPKMAFSASQRASAMGQTPKPGSYAGQLSNDISTSTTTTEEK